MIKADILMVIRFYATVQNPPQQITLSVFKSVRMRPDRQDQQLSVLNVGRFRSMTWQYLRWSNN